MRRTARAPLLAVVTAAGALGSAGLAATTASRRPQAAHDRHARRAKRSTSSSGPPATRRPARSSSTSTGPPRRPRRNPAAGHPHHQRLRRLQGRPGRARPGLRQEGLRGPVLLRARLRRLRLQDHPRRPRLGRPRRQAARDLSSAAASGPTTGRGSATSARTRSPTTGRARQHDPRVGMVGGSYGGQVQFAVAGIDPRVDTIVPIITWNDLAYSLAPNNTDFDAAGVTYRTPGTEKVGWTSLFFGAGIADGIEHAQTDPTRNVGCPNFADQACVAKAQMDALGYPTQDTLDLARHASVTTYVEKIRIPTLLVQGQNDTLFNLQEAVATYRALQRAGHADQDDLAVVGAQRQRRARARRAGHGRPGKQLRGPAVRPRGSPRTSRTGTSGPGREFAYFRDWVDYTGIATPAYGTRRGLPGGHHAAALPLRRRRAGRRQGAGAAGQRELRQRRRRDADELQRGLRPAGRRRPGRRHAAVRHPRHVRVVDAPRRWRPRSTPSACRRCGCGCRRRSPSRPRPADRPGSCCCSPRSTTSRPTAPTTLVHRLVSPTRVPDVREPVTHRAARRRAPLRGGPPDRGGRRGHRRGLPQQQGRAAGDGAHLARRPRRPDPAGARRRTLRSGRGVRPASARRGSRAPR